jgi:hypothetical protein
MGAAAMPKLCVCTRSIAVDDDAAELDFRYCSA